MPRTDPVSRRTLLRTGLAASAVGALAPSLLTSAATAAPPMALPAGGRVTDELRELERRHTARLGVYALNTRTGAAVAYRSTEVFPMCSTFKTLAAAAVLRDRDRHGEFLRELVKYTKADLVANSPITEKHVDTGMRIGELCAASIQYSDNTASNLVVRQLGGPAVVTRFCRTLGDPRTRLDGYEPIGDAIPGDPRDTTTPAAIGTDYRRLVLGHALNPGDRAQLTTWLKGNTTSTKRFVAGLPKNWVIGDKTGSGDYGTANDVGIAWTSRATPILLSVLSTKPTRPEAPYDDALVAETARVLARTLAPGE